MIRFVSMMHRGFLIGLFGLLTLISCTHTPVVKVSQDLEAVKGIVLNSAILAQGGNLALVPFRAGSSAEANEETDHLSMMILKGIKEGIEAQKTSLQIVDASETQPKIALQGYIEEFAKTGKLSRMMMRPNRDSLSLVGEVWLVSNGERLVNFTANKKFNPKKQKPVDIAYDLGKEIGDFIGSHSK